MTPSLRCLTPAQASAALGVSAKALRLYEQHGLLAPDRTRTGWRCYDDAAMVRATGIVSLRRLGLSLAQVARVLDGEPGDLDAGLAAHESRLRATVRQTTAALDRVRTLRADLVRGDAPSAATLARTLGTLARASGTLARASGPLAQALAERAPLGVGFALPWPWDGEWFALRDLPALSFLTGPLGSGKTRLARRLAEALPDAAFLGLDRLRDPAAAHLAGDAALADRVERRLSWLAEDGATRSEALTILVVALESDGPAALVIDAVEEGLDAATQVALMAHLRLRGTDRRALVLMTRSSSILDLDALEPAELVVLCPANHGVPLLAVPHPGGRGYEAVATCLAPPEVRARTAGIVAMRPA